jgi:hypothetical protein
MQKWQPVALANESIRSREGLRTNSDYRAYLQKNANSIRLYNLSISQQEVAKFPTVTQDVVVGPPHLYVTKTQPEAPNELNSDLKDWFFKHFKV